MTAPGSPLTALRALQAHEVARGDLLLRDGEFEPVAGVQAVDSIAGPRVAVTTVGVEPDPADPELAAVLRERTYVLDPCERVTVCRP